jgi:hypothetical protein
MIIEAMTPSYFCSILYSQMSLVWASSVANAQSGVFLPHSVEPGESNHILHLFTSHPQQSAPTTVSIEHLVHMYRSRKIICKSTYKLNFDLCLESSD